jgi:hypothetical protein
MSPDFQVKNKNRERFIGLLRQRLSKAHFISPERIRELRDLTRYHKNLAQEYTQQINYLQKVLQTANIKPSNVVNPISRQEQAVDTTGVEDKRQALTKLAYGCNKANLQELCQALEERVPTHQHFLISSILSHMDFLEIKIQNVQVAMKRCILSPEETPPPSNIVSTARQVDRDVVFSNSNIGAYRLAYEMHSIPWTGLYSGNRKSSVKRISDKTMKRASLRELAQSITGQDKDTFLSVFHRHETDRSEKKRVIITLTHKLLVTSYQILKNNKSHRKFTLDYHKQTDVIQTQPNRSYRSRQLVINCCISICLMAGLAFITHSPFVFPSLGPTVFLFFYKPTDPSSSPRNALISHSIATIVGYFSLTVTGLTAAGPALVVGVTWLRIIAVGLSLGLTIGLMVLLRATHPPAASTTLIISLGTLTKPWQLLVLMLAVVLLTMLAVIINRLAGIDYPLWRSQPTQTIFQNTAHSFPA